MSGRTRWSWLEQLRYDVRYATRGLSRTPWFAVAAVLTLTLGIAANSVVFSLVEAIVLHPLPGITDPSRLFQVVITPLSYPVFLDYQTENAPAAELAGFANRQLAVRVGQLALPATVTVVTGNYFSVLSGHVRIGRPLGTSDNAAGAAPVAVVSHRFWQERLGADPHAVGRTVFVSDAPLTVVGVADEAFHGTELIREPDLWTPIANWSLIRPSAFVNLNVHFEGWGWMTAIGRLRPGVSLGAAQRTAARVATHELERYPKLRRLYASLELRPLTQMVVGPDAHGTVVQFVVLLSSAVALVLLIACTNVAMLLLSRASRRQQEIVMRIALGASRARVVRQLMAESVVFAACAATAALTVTWAAGHALRHATLPGGITLHGLRAVSPGMLLFIATLSLATVLLNGLAPALHAVTDSSLASNERSRTQPRTRLRDALLITQVALSLVLLISAGLFLRGVRQALSINLGFSPDHLIAAMTNTGLVRLDTAGSERYYANAARSLSVLPGVRAVSWTATPPLSDHNVLDGTIEGHALPTGEQKEEFMVDIVGVGYAYTLGATVQQGREFTDADRKGAPLVAMVNESFARHYWPGADPIGKRITLIEPVTVVGVLRDVKTEHLDERPQPVAYFPLAQQPSWYLDKMYALVRTDGAPEGVLPAVVHTLRNVDPRVPVEHVAAFDDVLANVLMPQRLAAAVLAALGLMAIIVAAVGMYGVLAYVVSQRVREIGIRMALGARRGAVLGLVVGYHMRRVCIGIAIGLVIAAATTRAIANLIYGVSPLDGWTYACTAGLLAAVGLGAAYVPARRAVQVSPVEAIRAE